MRSDSTLSQVEANAQDQFPDLDAEKALYQYVIKYGVQGVFVSNEYGDCFIRGEDVKYYHSSHYIGYKYQWTKDRKGRNYYVRPYKSTLAQTNRPKKPDITALVVHPSEVGWNLPKTHQRHLLKFPQEILDSIFKFALVAPARFSIKPDVVSSNWKRAWSMPDFVTKGFNCKGEMVHKKNTTISRGAIKTPTQDDDGPYTELRDVHRALIDAVCLRTNHKIYDTYINLLYSTNNFYFSMVNTSTHRSPPTMLPKGKDFKVWRPRKETQTEPSQSLKSPTKYTSKPCPAGHTMTRSSAFSTRSDQERCSSKAHHVLWEDICGTYFICDDDLGSSLRNYMPFIIALCTGLEQLRIRAKEDVNYDAVLHPVDEGMPAKREDVLKPIFEKELRGIPSLKKLEVVGNVQWERGGLEFADETIAWFENRERHRILQELRAEKAKHQEKIAGEVETAGEVKCDFCGEGHLWVECWNLCNFCGAYGRFRDHCPEKLP